MRQIRRQVHRKPVHRDPAADADTDGSDLRLIAIGAVGPDAHTPFGAPRFDTEVGQRIDDPAFDGMNKSAHIARTFAKIEHEVADPLPGAVVGVPSAAPGLDHLETGIEQFCGGGAGARRVDRRMLQQPDQFARLASGNRSIAGSHLAKRLAIRHQYAFLPDLDLVRFLHGQIAWPRSGLMASMSIGITAQLQGVRIVSGPARAPREREMTAVKTLDSSAAWASATRMVAANRDLLMAIAGVFFVLPGLAGAVFVPSPAMTSGMTEAQMLACMQNYYASSFPILLLLSLLPMAGMLTMLVAMLDATRPTVAEAIRRSLRALPSYFAAQLLIAFAILPLSMALASVLALALPDRVAVSVALGILLYPIMRTMLVGPVVAGQAVRNPVAAIRESIRMTRGNAGRILLFIGLAGFVFLVVYGLVMMFVGVVLVLVFKGSPSVLLVKLSLASCWRGPTPILSPCSRPSTASLLVTRWVPQANDRDGRARYPAAP